ncbi:hypothetical protein AMS68_005557 [Peltaster fructicola]|uniref:RTA1 like protein n=1 Tax=Peltaster fructicola TaxID=286661 RepID=A0A6H0Y062_9PEZI|nr:hypothetical protein AMS68_005557 [Peltaster fructicola]
MSTDNSKFVLYYYTPSLPAAVVSVAVFAILTVAHIWKLCKFRTFYFLPFVIGGIFETIGYSASIYMILGRLIRALGADGLSVIRVNSLTKLFVTGDIVSFMMQCFGGGMSAAKSAKMLEIGRILVIVGLFAQITFFGFFVVTAVVFHVRARASPTPTMSNTTLPWQRHLVVLYVTSVLILVRSVVRAIEYLQGNDGYLLSNEIFIYIFDALLMAAVMAILWVWYVGDLQPRRTEIWAEEETLKA